MSELFESITIEIKRSTDSAWVDVTTDVLHNPAPRGSTGIMDNGWLNRVASVGRFKFSLDNSASNSQSTLGYYSPFGTGEILGGTEVRVGFKYAGRKRYKWAGIVEPGGATPTAIGEFPIKVDVSCYDWFGIIAYFPLDFLARSTNKTIVDGVALILASLPAGVQPTYVTYNTATYTFPTIFDLMSGETTAIGEFNKLAISEMGYIYAKGNEIDGLSLVVDGKLTRWNVASDTFIPRHSSVTTDDLLLANGVDKLLLANSGTDNLLLTETIDITFNQDDMLAGSAMGKSVAVSFGRHYANYIKAAVTPRRVDTAATTVLFTMESSVLVEAGATVSGLRGRYRDPSGASSYVNGTEMVTPVATTDYRAFANADGTGTEYTANCTVTATFGTAEVEFSITNTGAFNFYVGGDIIFQFRGKGIYAYDVVDIILDRSDPTSKVGRRLLSFDMVYQSDPVAVKLLLDTSVLRVADDEFVDIKAFPLLANRDVRNMMAFMYLEPGSRATFSEPYSFYAYPSFINGYDFEILEMKYVTWAPVLARRDTSVPSA